MARKPKIIIAGAGGIGQATALILAEFSEDAPKIFIGNRHVEKARQVGQWVALGTARAVEVVPFHLPEKGLTDDFKAILEEGEVLLDCLPGSQAPRMARLAREYGLHYANLTEYVAETEEIKKIAEEAETAFLLQTGLAPGFVDVLGHGLFQRFCRKHGVSKAHYLAMKVGALTRHATPPHYYGFTWSSVGVATEYVHQSVCIRDFKRTVLPALSERERIIINGFSYEADLTSGGAADLPEALAGKVERLDYKTLRYPGHFDWVQQQLNSTPPSRVKVKHLQELMVSRIPVIQDDTVLIYASVEGQDGYGNWQKMERTYHLKPQQIGRHRLRAIQATTAGPLAEAAFMLLDTKRKGVIQQSQINAEQFLNGPYVTAIFGKWDEG